MSASGGGAFNMRRIKILHAADLHLDSPFEGLSASKAAIRRAEQKMLLASLTDLAIKENVDLVLLSGDLLDSSNTFHETGEELIRSLAKIPCPVFISPGSQDYYDSRCPYARLKMPDNVHVFHDTALRFVSVPSADARVFGAAFTGRQCPPLLRGFHAQRRSGVYNLLCVHGEVGTPNSTCNPISTEDLAASGIDYAALGHVHSRSGLLRSGGTWYSWPGCPEGRGFAESGDKTVNIVELSGEECSLKTASIALRSYRKLTLDISRKDPLLLIHTSLPDDTVNDIYRITLVGKTDSAPDLRWLHQNLDEMFFSLQLVDQTTVRPEIWESAGDDTLRGLFLSKLRVRYDAAQDDRQRERIEQAVRWGLAALDNAGEVVIHDNP